MRMPASASRASPAGPTPPHARHLQPRQARLDPGVVDDHQAVGLVEVGRDLREELVRRDADGRGEVDGVAQRGLDARRGLDHRTVQTLGPREVEERLVDAERLDGRRERVEAREHLLRHFVVHATARRDDDRVGTPSLRDGHRLRGVTSEAPRLVRRRCDHAARAVAADQDRLPAQLGTVALLDGREERVHVDMQDAASIRHRTHDTRARYAGES